MLRGIVNAGLLRLVAWAALCLLAVPLNGTAQPAHPVSVETQHAGVTAHIDVLGQAFRAPPPVARDQARIIIYRTNDNRLPGATSIFIDDRYHASLVRGAWSALCYRPGSVEMGARQMDAANRPKDLVDAITVTRLEGGSTHYFKVQDHNGRPVLQPIPAVKAQQENSAALEQIHTVSRVAQECRIDNSPQRQRVTEEITLSAHTLFAFDRSDPAAMTEQGVRSINDMVDKILNDFVEVEHLHLVGHADPLGKKDANELLGINRARTVKQYIERRQLSGVRITTEGRGDREPIVTNCAPIDTPESIRCNLPNRRVVVQVTGYKRQIYR
ncbi:OmpA family protein [Limnohabitans sp. T6-5]|uniref:OmpA family protein n=1 Tax=Limnohabitans sp. T6-5 TaxID=1100724 RepID=UPI001304C8CC|nr:OmpA family protein [Limnohabitans sp. T6-5]